MSRSASRKRAATRVVHTAAPVVTSHESAIIGQSNEPVRMSFTATAMFATGRTRTTDRNAMPGRNGTMPGTRASRKAGMKYICASL